MIEIDNKLISQEIFKEAFACDLNACKGACCIEGDAGAPLEEDETKVLEKIHEDVKPFLRKEGIDAIEKGGLYTQDHDGEWVTQLVNGKECAYVIFDEKGITKCGIEKAYEAGVVDFKKPISCHLYPIRTQKFSSTGLESINYDRWSICDPARSCGLKLELKVFRFLKDPLIRKYGESFYKELEIINEHLENSVL